LDRKSVHQRKARTGCWH